MNITPLPLRITKPRPKDPTGASRQKRYRDKRRRDAILANPLENNNATVTDDGSRVSITLGCVELDRLASRIASGPVTRHERYIASQVVLEYMFAMPEDTAVTVDIPIEET